VPLITLFNDRTLNGLNPDLNEFLEFGRILACSVENSQSGWIQARAKGDVEAGTPQHQPDEVHVDSRGVD
jgi:hypothetical protein